MKKVKIMLTAITVFAVVGGALAFKATKFNSTLFCSTEENGQCNIPKAGFSIEPLPGQTEFVSSTCTNVLNGDCKFRPTYVNQ